MKSVASAITEPTATQNGSSNALAIPAESGMSSKVRPWPLRWMTRRTLPSRMSAFSVALSFGPDLGTTREAVGRCDESDRAVQALVIVIRDKRGDYASRLVEGARRLGTNRCHVERLMPALELPIRLRIVWRRAHMGHAGAPDELLEVLRDELRTIVRDDARRHAWVLFVRPL